MLVVGYQLNKSELRYFTKNTRGNVDHSFVGGVIDSIRNRKMQLFSAVVNSWIPVIVQQWVNDTAKGFFLDWLDKNIYQGRSAAYIAINNGKPCKEISKNVC